MTRKDGFVEYVLELLEPLGPVRARAMFGGWGLYLEGGMFALIAEGRLYLKVDDTTRPAFQAAGCEPFVYAPGEGRKPVTMSYWTPPSDAADDALALLPWARRALEAARRAREAKALAPARRKAPPPPRKAPAPARKKSSARAKPAPAKK